jgi:hypothetical protein
MGSDKENDGYRGGYAPNHEVTVPPRRTYSASTCDNRGGHRPRLGIDCKHIVNISELSPFNSVESLANDIGNLEKAKSTLKKRLNGHLVSSVEDGGSGASLPTGSVSQVERRKGLSVNILKRQFPPC